jgi:hypothetical protein
MWTSDAGYDGLMSEQTPELGEGTDIDAAELDVEAPVENPPASSDAEEYVDDGETLGGTGGLNAGGAG